MRIEGEVMTECRFVQTLRSSSGYQRVVTRCDQHGISVDGLTPDSLIGYSTRSSPRCPIGRIEDLEERLARVGELLDAIFPAE